MVIIRTAFNNMYHIYPNDVGKVVLCDHYTDPELETQIMSCIKTLFFTSGNDGYVEFTETELKKCITCKRAFNSKDIYHILNRNSVKYYYYYGLYRCAL